MSTKHLQREPHEIDDNRWWYEEPGGILVVAEVTDGKGDYLGTTQTTIKWSALRAAMKRLDKK